MVTLVTGGTGFVGANIVKDLADNGHHVVSFDINGPDKLLEDFVGQASSQWHLSREISSTQNRWRG